MGIVEFLEARLTEDEMAAKKAAASTWVRDDNDVRHDCGDWEARDEKVAMRPALDGPRAWGAATCRDLDTPRHIARHDPDRILREVAGKRAIIEAAEEASGLDMSLDMDRCVGSRDLAEDPYVGDVILRALASVYADHSDFNEEWRP